MELEILRNPDECRAAWQKYWPVEGLFDLWAVRFCFHAAFDRPLLFLLARNNGRVEGFLPLCWNEDSGNYVIFPGETWQGKTWLEQNRLIARTPEVLTAMLQAVPGPVNLRYLNMGPLMDSLESVEQDEIGYLFHPARHEFSMEKYWAAFPGKSRKKILAEIDRLKAKGLTFRFDQEEDIEAMFQLNMNAFNEYSYFYDNRFYNAFKRLAAFLRDTNMLRITTVLAGDEIAAVDMGAMFNGSYTLLAGGTNSNFLGIAKFINLHHLEWSCRQRFEKVDFLCGDFNWKARFRLTPRPLYALNHLPLESLMSTPYLREKALAYA